MEMKNFESKELGRTYDQGRKQTKKTLGKLSERLEKRGRQSWRALGTLIEKAGKLVETGLVPVLSGIGFATRKDLARIDARLDKLAQQIRRLEKGA